MGGFGLDGYRDRIPCPHCGGTDCMKFDYSEKGTTLVCSETNKKVS